MFPLFDGKRHCFFWYGADLLPQKLVHRKCDFSIYDGPPGPEEES